MNKKINNTNPGKKKRRNIPKEPPKNGKNLFVLILVIVGLFYIFQWVFTSLEQTNQEMTYKQFYQALETNDTTGAIQSAVKIKDNVYEIVTDISESSEFFTVFDKLENDAGVNAVIIINEDKVLGESEYRKYLDSIFEHDEEDTKWSHVELKNIATRTRQIVILNKLIKKIVKFPKLVAAALNGEIVTPFFGASLAADIRFASDNVNFVLTHTKMNIHPSGALPYFLSKYIGHGKASNILFGKEGLTASDALELGLLSALLPKENFEDIVIDEIYKLTNSSSNAYNCTKALLNCNFNDLEKYLSLEECDFKQH